MVYKYYTQKILESGVDANSIFPQKQEFAKATLNVSYGLFDVLRYLQTASNNFTVSDIKLMDMDSAIFNVFSNHYRSIGEPNPFDKAPDTISEDDELLNEQIRTPYEVKDGKAEPSTVKIPAPAGSKKAAKTAEPPAEKAPEKPAGKAAGKTPKKPAYEVYSEQDILEWEEKIETLISILADGDSSEQAEWRDMIEGLLELLADEPQYSKAKIKAYKAEAGIK